jgi:tRNA U34 5-carboxymethylaminomethyl modifying GTPase MnmE/TrmE
LTTCHESISSLKNLNGDLNAKLEKATSSCVEHVVICNRCKDVGFDEHATTIAKLNNEVASLNAQLKTCMDNYEKLKFARDAYTVGRHPSIKDGLGFRK